MGNGSVIDRSVKLGDADIHLESEPSGTFLIETGQATERRLKGLGAAGWMPLFTPGTEADGDRRRWGSLVLAYYDVDLRPAENIAWELTGTSHCPEAQTG